MVEDLDVYDTTSTYWVVYKKLLILLEYFYSFGKFLPELINYFGNAEIKYNYNRDQNFRSIKCDHYYLRFSYK